MPLLIFVISLLSYAPAIAQELPGSDEYALLFADIPTVLAAARHLQPVTQAPASVDIVTAQQIQRFGYRTLAEAIGALPGFQTTYDRGYHHLQTRGFFLPGDYNSRILLLIDGHRVNENLQDYAGIGTDFLLDLDDIDRIEVIRGPGSALYGSSAFLAVVNVITRSGADINGARLDAEAGSFATYAGQVSAGQLFSNGLEAYFSASRHRSDGRRVLNPPALGKARELDGQDGRRLFGKVSWHSWTLSGAYMERNKTIPEFIGVTNTIRTTYADWRAYADLRNESRLGPWWTTLRLFWDRYEFHGKYPYDPVTNHDWWHGEWAGLETTARRHWGDHHVLLGGEYRGNYLQRMDNFDHDPKTVWAKNRTHSTFFGFFAQDTWQLTSSLTLYTGLRIDHYSRTGDTPVTPRIGTIISPWPGTTLKLLYGHAYRAPTAFESDYACCSDTWIGNSTLEPERIRTLEGVWEQRLGHHLDGRLSAYFYKAKSLIQLREQAGISRFENTGQARAAGMEALLRYHYAEAEGQVSYSFHHTVDGHGKRWPNTSRHLFKSRLNLPLWQDRLYGALEINYISPRKTEDSRETGDTVQMNLTLSSRGLLPGLEASLSLYNLLDDHYHDPPAPPVIPSEIPQNGRTFRIKVSYRF